MSTVSFDQQTLTCVLVPVAVRCPLQSIVTYTQRMQAAGKEAVIEPPMHQQQQTTEAPQENQDSDEEERWACWRCACIPQVASLCLVPPIPPVHMSWSNQHISMCPCLLCQLAPTGSHRACRGCGNHTTPCHSNVSPQPISANSIAHPPSAHLPVPRVQ